MAKNHLCTVEYCNRPPIARGWCNAHYHCWLRNGNPTPTIIMYDDKRRFMSHIKKVGDCWVWQRCKNKQGYGKFQVDRKTKSAHRWSYETFIGRVPKGLVLDHLCCNTSCVNPAHLEPVTQRENTLRGNAIKKKVSNLPPGVGYHNGKYRARKCISGKSYFLGHFQTPDEAYQAYLSFSV